MLVKEFYMYLQAVENVKICSKKQKRDVWIGLACYIPSEYMFESIIAIYSMPYRDNDSIITIVIR